MPGQGKNACLLIKSEVQTLLFLLNNFLSSCFSRSLTLPSPAIPWTDPTQTLNSRTVKQIPTYPFAAPFILFSISYWHRVGF